MTASTRFVALDFETANESLDSICQIGVASFAGGRLVGSWETLVDPDDGFAKKNIAIHGITPDAVKGAPRFPAVFERLCELLLDGQAIAHHCIFERVALARAVVKYQLKDPVPVRSWLDTASVVHLTWPEREYNLAAVAEFLRIEFKHHNAIEDARVAGEILLRAILETGLDVAS